MLCLVPWSFFFPKCAAVFRLHFFEVFCIWIVADAIFIPRAVAAVSHFSRPPKIKDSRPAEVGLGDFGWPLPARSLSGVKGERSESKKIFPGPYWTWDRKNFLRPLTPDRYRATVPALPGHLFPVCTTPPPALCNTIPRLLPVPGLPSCVTSFSTIVENSFLYAHKCFKCPFSS